MASAGTVSIDDRSISESTNGGFPLLGEEMKSRVAAMGRQLEPRKPGPHPRAAQSLDTLSRESGL